jgi:hypothetical protein
VATFRPDSKVPHDFLPVATVGRVVAAILREVRMSVLNQMGDLMRHRIGEQVVPPAFDLKGRKVKPQLASSGLSGSRSLTFEFKADRGIDFNPIEFLRTLDVELDLLGDFDFSFGYCHAEL